MQSCLPFFDQSVEKASKGIGRTLGQAACLLLILTWMIGCAAPVFALSQARLRISGLQTSAFPNNAFQLDVADGAGKFVADLKPDELVIREDGQVLPAAGLLPQRRALQFSLAVNSAPGFAPGPGSAPLDGLREAMRAWIGGQAGQTGDFSLATNTGLQLIRGTSAQLVTRLAEYQPDFAKVQSNLFSLTTALDLALEQAGKNGQQPAILFATPPLGEAEAAGLSAETRRAAQAGVPVFVWLVVPDLNSDPASIPGFQELSGLAEQSGGLLALVSGAGGFPDLESWLGPLRQVYQVSYQSQARSSGTHSLSVEIKRPGLELVSEQTLSFKLELGPPNPMFVNPPAQVALEWLRAEGQPEAALSPRSLPLQILVEFPDQIQRSLASARLYVNGQLAAENTSAPFDRFEWDLGGLSQSGQVKLRVEVVDSLGLSGSSIEVPVEVSVASRPSSSGLPNISSQGLLAVGAVVLAGAALALIVAGEQRLRARQQGKARLRARDPLTQPVPVGQDRPSRLRKPGTAMAWPRIERGQPAPARMLRLNELDGPPTGSPVLLARQEVTFGSDPHLVVVAVDEPSVHPLHARLTRSGEGSFVLSDEGSVAGTWVNFVKINGKGQPLHHGDLVHLGRAMFRFELSAAPPPQEFEVSLVDDSL